MSNDGPAQAHPDDPAPSRLSRSGAWAEVGRALGRAALRAVAGLPMGLALSAVTAVWVFGAVWSFTEQSAFATAKQFSDPALLPLVLDGLAISMAGVAFAASLDARPAIGARAGTALAVAASATSNGLWAAERTLGPTGPDLTTVTLGVGIPIAANIAFEVLLAELRRQVQRRRGLPAPAPLPTLRPIRLLLAPSSTFRTWRSEVLTRTTPTLGLDAPGLGLGLGLDVLGAEPCAVASEVGTGPGSGALVHHSPDSESSLADQPTDETNRAGNTTVTVGESTSGPSDAAGPVSPDAAPAPRPNAPGESSVSARPSAPLSHPDTEPGTSPDPQPEPDPGPVRAPRVDASTAEPDAAAASGASGTTTSADPRVQLLIEGLAHDPEITGKDAETALAEAGMSTSYRNARRLLAEARTAAATATSDPAGESVDDHEPARTGTDDTVVPAALSLVRHSASRTSTEGDH